MGHTDLHQMLSNAVKYTYKYTTKDPPGQNIVLPPFALMFPGKKDKRKPMQESFPASSENSIVNFFRSSGFLI